MMIVDPMMIPFHEAIARALVLVTDQTIEFCRGQVIATRRETHTEEDPLYDREVPEEAVPAIARQLRQQLPEGERESISYADRLRRRAVSASHGLARMLDDAGIPLVPNHHYTKAEVREYLYREALAAYAISYAKAQDDEEVVKIALDEAKRQGNAALERLCL